MKKPVSNSFAGDPRVIEAKHLLLETLGEYQNRITGIRPADPDLQKSYAEIIGESTVNFEGAACSFPIWGAGLGGVRWLSWPTAA